MMGFLWGGGGVGLSSCGGVGLFFYFSMIHLSACNMGWARGVVMVVGDL